MLEAEELCLEDGDQGQYMVEVKKLRLVCSSEIISI